MKLEALEALQVISPLHNAVGSACGLTCASGLNALSEQQTQSNRIG